MPRPPAPVAWLVASLLLLGHVAHLAAPRVEAAAGGTMPAADLVAAITAGHPVELQGETILGDVDLTGLDTVSRVLRCTDCTFTGAVRASNVVFDRIVDLSGDTVRGDLDLSGAVMRDAFLMASSSAAAPVVAGDARFALATFAGRATFDGITFRGTADFGGAQFGGAASFTDAEMGGPGLFGSVLFKGDADFSSSPAGPGAGAAPADPGPPPSAGCPPGTPHAFERGVTFKGATFGGKADFRQRCFVAAAAFTGAGMGAADFSLDAFLGDAAFDGVAISGAATFRAATFGHGATFGQASLHGPVDFDGAAFGGSLQLFRASVGQLLSLQQVIIGGTLQLDGAQIARLHLALADLDHVLGNANRERALSVIETTARGEGDLSLANDAAFMRSSMETQAATGSQHALDLVLEQGAGYFVKPYYPLIAIVELLLVGTAVRTVLRVSAAVSAARVRRRQRAVAGAAGVSPIIDTPAPTRPVAEPSADPSRGSTRVPAQGSSTASARAARRTVAAAVRGRAAGRAVARVARRGGAAMSTVLKRVGDLVLTLARAASASLRALVRTRPDDLPEDGHDSLVTYGRVLVAGAEWLAYKLLVAAIVIGLANSNPTFKQLLEAVAK